MAGVVYPYYQWKNTPLPAGKPDWEVDIILDSNPWTNPFNARVSHDAEADEERRIFWQNYPNMIERATMLKDSALAGEKHFTPAEDFIGYHSEVIVDSEQRFDNDVETGLSVVSDGDNTNSENDLETEPQVQDDPEIGTTAVSGVNSESSPATSGKSGNASDIISSVGTGVSGVLDSIARIIIGKNTSVTRTEDETNYGKYLLYFAMVVCGIMVINKITK